MTKYRIAKRGDGLYIIQWKLLCFWLTERSEFGGIPYTYCSLEDAREEIKKYYKKVMADAPLKIVYEGTGEDLVENEKLGTPETRTL